MLGDRTCEYMFASLKVCNGRFVLTVMDGATWMGNEWPVQAAASPFIKDVTDSPCPIEIYSELHHNDFNCLVPKNQPGSGCFEYDLVKTASACLPLYATLYFLRVFYWFCDNIASVLCFGPWPQGMWDLRSLIMDWTCTPCIGRQSVTTGLTGSLCISILQKFCLR